MVKDGKSGFVVPPRDPGAIASKVQYFADNPGEAKKMGQEARFEAATWTWNRMEEELAKKVVEL